MKYEFNPNNFGRDCAFDGKHFDEDGNLIECCCDECDFAIGCIVPEEILNYLYNGLREKRSGK